jgi:hypothetical protein
MITIKTPGSVSDINTTHLSKYTFVNGICKIKSLPENDELWFKKHQFSIEIEEIKDKK